MAKQYEMARLDEAREGAVIQVVDEAVAPERKSKPKRGLISALTSIGTLFILVVFLFLRRSIHDTGTARILAEKVGRLRSLLRLPLT